MKKLYLIGLGLIMSVSLLAQSAVTLRVDMSQETVSADGVHVAGNFNTGGDYPEWDPAGIMLSDDDTDGVYEVTLMLAEGTYNFKYINGNAWGSDESAPEACAAPGSTDRVLVVTSLDSVQEIVCFGLCTSCDIRTVVFSVDMSFETLGVNPAGVHVAGNFQGNNPSSTEMLDEDMDMIYTYTWTYEPEDATMPDTLIFKYINGDEYTFAENITGDCGDGGDFGDRQEVISETMTMLPMYCFNSCSSCIAPTPVTFSVDMSSETVGAGGVHLAGAFASGGDYPDWNPGGIEMLDDNLDNIYEVALDLAPGTYQYKVVNGSTWDDPNENPPAECNVGGNREIEVVEGDSQEVAFCYNQCTPECIENPDPADITFRIDMSETLVAAEGIFLIGNFTDPVWQGGATQLMDPDVDGIYEATLTVSGGADIQYKFVNGDVNVSENEENAGIEECGIDNGVGGFNRTHTRSGVAEILDVACFDVCECVVSVEEISLLNSLNIFPNPASDNVTITFDSEVVNTISVINSLGQLVINEAVVQNGRNVITLNTSNLSTGLYTVQLAGEGLTVNKPLMVK
ncbi:MAG: T9SS type A sorting domain-containing protein [Flavobacteriales bacterium]